MRAVHTTHAGLLSEVVVTGCNKGAQRSISLYFQYFFKIKNIAIQF